MIVNLRDIDDATAVYFEAIEFHQIDDLIDFIKRSGGVYSTKAAEHLPFHSYQIVLDGSSEAFAEIIVGKEEE
jgi:hypothetical protein